MKGTVSEGAYDLLFGKMRASVARYFEMEMPSKRTDGRRLVGRARPNEMEAHSGPRKKAVCKRGK